MLSSTLTLPGLIVKLSPAGCDLPCTALEVKGYLIVVPGAGLQPLRRPRFRAVLPDAVVQCLPASRVFDALRRTTFLPGNRESWGRMHHSPPMVTYRGSRGSIIGSGGGSGSIDAQPLLEPLQEVVELVLLLRHSLTCWA